MKKLIPLAAGAIACLVAVGSAQAAPASGNVLGKLTAVGQSDSAFQQAHYYRRHHRWWWGRPYYYRHHHHRRWHHWY